MTLEKKNTRKKKYLKGVAITKNWSYLKKKKSLFLNVFNLYFKNIILAKSNYLEWKSLVFQISHLMCVCIYIYIYEQKYLKNKSVYRVKYLYF